MVRLEDIIARDGYLVDSATGEKVIFYECDPEKIRNVSARSVVRNVMRMKVVLDFVLKRLILNSARTVAVLGTLC